MSNKLITINARLRALPSWLKINNTITFSLPLKSAKELAKKLVDAEDSVDVEIKFSSGKENDAEIEGEKKSS